MTEEFSIPCRVLLSGIPEDGFDGFEGYCNIAAGLQRKDQEEPGEDFGADKLAFTCALRVRKDPKSGRPNFLGEHAFGTPGERFLYIRWSGEKNGKRECFRRIKVSLRSIEWRQVEAAAAQEDELLEAEISALAKDGGPACASVPLLGKGWRIAEA